MPKGESLGYSRSVDTTLFVVHSSREPSVHKTESFRAQVQGAHILTVVAVSFWYSFEKFL
ncbi:hypothetical protein EG68_06162 [Paragonimus skrjabini miyazakii]|uniref:Uncharacterized protein n=1 Tax=Paragonimus skrjabini miyazakii TaxID=59628 RepID=A0A8S9YNZ3_9TREM|nr:hypothetical protein EG68_06162 [Paragonimus skrjabini miyazakii]